MVGGLCAGVHNTIMIGGAALRLHYVLTSAVSYTVVVLLGFGLHTRFTFSEKPEWAAFARYAAGMALNFPIWLVLMFLLNDTARIPMLFASPIGTLLMLIWNYGVSRWAILRRATTPSGRTP
jgi:putative flippase GtrA